MNQVVQRERAIPAPAEVVFELLADPAGWPAWSGHDRGEVVSDGPGDPRGVGAVRAFTRGRIRSVEEIVAFDPPRHLAYVLRSGLPLRGYRADVELTPGPGQGCTVRWRSTFRARVPGTGPLFRFALGRFLEQMLRGLAVHADGRSVSTSRGVPADSHAS